MSILDQILDSIKDNGNLSMFLGGFIEQIIVPIPSPIITMAGGAFLVARNQGFFETFVQLFTKVSIPYSIGATIGTSLVYWFAYVGGKPIIDKFGKYIGISWNLIEKVRADFQKSIKDELFILIACTIPVVPVSLVTGFCGGFKIPPKKFYPMVFIALLIRAAFLGFVGFKMSETFTDLAEGIDRIESVFQIIGIVALLAFLYYKRESYLKKNE